jgi:hypothetical protein
MFMDVFPALKAPISVPRFDLNPSPRWETRRGSTDLKRLFAVCSFSFTGKENEPKETAVSR